MWQHITTGILTASLTPLHSSLTDAAPIPVTTGHKSPTLRIVAYYSGDHSLKIQGFIGIVALQGATGGFRPYSNRINTEALYS
jgi:hypothetical protein